MKRSSSGINWEQASNDICSSWAIASLSPLTLCEMQVKPVQDGTKSIVLMFVVGKGWDALGSDTLPLIMKTFLYSGSQVAIQNIRNMNRGVG